MAQGRCFQPLPLSRCAFFLLQSFVAQPQNMILKLEISKNEQLRKKCDEMQNVRFACVVACRRVRLLLCPASADTLRHEV